MSSDDIAISVHNLTKSYRLFGHPGDRVKQFFSLGLKQYHREFTALKDVSFDVRRGETVGIIGRNGSGKSTLLQLICGILKPSSGTVQVNGRVSALLELGAGFNPEFTGRENVYFQCALLGLTTAEVDQRFDEIAEFADIGEFIDEPVRIYSSGMFVRLAFATAVHVTPNILIVDEAMAVGDARFQSRCMHRIEELQEAGCTILMVSHSLDQIVRACDRAILLDGGELVVFDTPKYAVGQFQRLLSAPMDERNQLRHKIRSECTSLNRNLTEISSEELNGQLLTSNIQSPAESFDPSLKPQEAIAYESRGAVIEDVRILNLLGERVNNLMSGGVYRYTYRVRFERDAASVQFGMLIKTQLGIELGGAMSGSTMTGGISTVTCGSVIEVEFRFNCMLNPGTYFLNAGVFESNAGVNVTLHRVLDAAIFRVVSPAQSTATAIVDFGCRASTHVIERMSRALSAH